MFFKLSFKNVKKSFRDYTLYFLTLTFGVCVFYVFNSIESQKAMMKISTSTLQMMKTLTQLMGYVSVFVSFILGFLIVYANNFLVRRRKKEFGIYMIHGMEKGKVAKLLVSETFLIGTLSLFAGLFAGVFISQGLSVVTAKLFEVDMTAYRFVFSPGAFVKTIIYFSIIFITVMVMSTVSISKYKLIDLINAEKQNEKPKIKSPVITILLFILSIGCIGTAYYLVLKNGIIILDRRLFIEILLGSIGTFLFFASLSGFFLKFIQSNKKLYFKGLNMFILRQINSRINTTHISISLICLMLFCTIGILSTGMGFNNAMNESYKYCTPYDVSFWSYDTSFTSDENLSILGKLNEYGFNLYNYTDEVVETAVYKYADETFTKRIILEKAYDFLPKSMQLFQMDTPLFLLKLSDYNKLMRLQGSKEISLTENQVAVYSDYAESTPDLKKALIKFTEMKDPISISGKNYEVYPEVLTNGIITSPASGIMLALVVPDHMVKENTVYMKMLSFNCKGDKANERKEMLLKIESDLLEFGEKFEDVNEELKLSGITAESVKNIATGLKAVIAFIGIYLGIIFLISSAAVLALQQLSEAADNRHRYNILQKLGADSKLINSALFRQIAIYFMLPLALACIHSIVGIKVANDAIADTGDINAVGNIIMTAILIIIVYGAYFLATYFSSKNIILNKKTAN